MRSLISCSVFLPFGNLLKYAISKGKLEPEMEPKTVQREVDEGRVTDR